MLMPRFFGYFGLTPVLHPKICVNSDVGVKQELCLQLEIKLQFTYRFC